MKILQKIKLINWHFFDDATFDVKGNVVIFGENGCGKSTIIDAIHYVLSGGDCDFNKAANSANSSRSVYSYMKARVGAETEEYARPQGDIITHIALQFLDSYNNQPLVVGVVLQIAADQQPTNRFYYFRGTELRDDLFYTGGDKKTVRNGDSYFDYCRSQKIDIQSLDADGRAKTCQERMDAVMEVTKTYPSLLEKAISFSGLGGIDDFARKFLFKEDSLSFEALVKPALEYQRIKTQLEQEEKKADALKLVSDLAPQYREAMRGQWAYAVVRDSERIALKFQAVEANRGDQERIAAILKTEEAEEKNLKEQDQELRDRESTLSSNNPAVDKLKLAETNETRAKENLRKAEQDVTSLIRLVRQEQNLADELQISTSLKAAVDMEDYDSFYSAAKSYKKDLGDFQEKQISQRAILKSTIESNQEKLDALTDQIDDLKRNVNIPAPVKTLIDLIKMECSRHGLKESEVYAYPVCEYLEVTDERWRPSLEGLLGVYRFDLLVSNAAFKIAYETFLSHPELKDYFGFGVLSQDALTGEAVPEDSIASFIKSDNAWALNYARKLLGSIKAVEGSPVPASGQKSVTADGFFFDGFALRHLDAQTMARPYLGQASKRLALEQDQKEFAQLSSVQDADNKSFTDKGASLSKIDHESHIGDLLAMPNIFFALKQAQTACKSGEEQVRILKQDESLLKIQTALEALNKDKKAFKENRDAFSERNRHHHDDQIHLEDAGKQFSLDLDGLKDTAKQTLQEAGTLLDGVNLEPYKGGRAGTDLIAFALDRIKESKTTADNIAKRLVTLFGEYNSEFGSDLSPTIESLDDYLAIYNQCSTIDIAQLKPKAEAEHQNMEKVFRENFAARLMDHILEAKTVANRLNSVLRGHQFGTEKGTFQLVVGTTENADFKNVSIVLEKMTHQVYGAVGVYDSLEAPEKEAFDKIFAVLLANQSGADNSKLLDAYCDYRNYMSYDIKETKANGMVSSYKHNQNAFSGGETQTPFYVMVAAAFGSGFTARNLQKSSPCGLVILDEAFNNMDENRIKEMLDFYKELDIQLIISVPTTRSALLTGKVNTSIALVRRGSQVSFYTTYHE
jgi:uncharacterized protein YPO0396